MRFLVSPTRKMRFSVTSPTQNAPFGHVEVASLAQTALFRYVAAREAWDTTPPASLRGTMESGPTGKTCSSNPPPGWRGVALGPASLGPAPHGKAQSEQRASLRAHPGPGRDTIGLPVVG